MVKKKAVSSSVKRLVRKEKNRIIGGVAKGIADYFGLDANLVRVVFILLAIFNGGGLFLYIILWLLLPSEKSSHEEMRETVKENADEIKNKAIEFAEKVQESPQTQNGRYWIGFFLFSVGVVFLLENFGFSIDNIVRFWPILLIILGFLFLKKL